MAKTTTESESSHNTEAAPRDEPHQQLLASAPLMPPVIAEALSKLQGEVKALVKNGRNSEFNSTYAQLNDVQDCALPLLSKHGLALSQWPISSNGTFYLRSLLVHTSGVGMQEDIELLLAKRDAQGLGSSITYTRRQTTMAILGLSAEDDDDGNKAAGRQSSPTAEQISEARQLCIDLNFPRDQVEVRVDSLRTEDHATVAIAKLRKMMSEKAKQIKSQDRATPVFTNDRDQVVPVSVIQAAKKDEASDDVALAVGNRILKLPISEKAKRGLVNHVVKKPFLKNCSPDQLTAVAEVVDAIQSGTYEIPADWIEAEVSPPEHAA